MHCDADGQAVRVQVKLCSLIKTSLMSMVAKVF